MDMSALGYVTETVAADRTGSAARLSLSREDFLKIMISEMTHQDPMNPVDNQDFLNQLVQLETLQATTALADGIARLMAMQQIGAASQMIGRNVRAAAADGESIAGTVQKVVIQGGEASVVIDGRSVPFALITEVEGQNAGE